MEKGAPVSMDDYLYLPLTVYQIWGQDYKEPLVGMDSHSNSQD